MGSLKGFCNFQMADNDVKLHAVIAAEYYKNSKKKCINIWLGGKTKLLLIESKKKYKEPFDLKRRSTTDHWTKQMKTRVNAINLNK